MSSAQAHIEIAVQPLPYVGVSRTFVPPVVARTRDPQLLEYFRTGTRQLFATAMLFSTNMDDCTSFLIGNWNASAKLVSESSGHSRGGGSSSRSSAEQWLYFIFNPVSIAVEGIFAFNLVVSALEMSSPDEAGVSQVVGGRATRQFNVVARPPRAVRPSKSVRVHELNTRD